MKNYFEDVAYIDKWFIARWFQFFGYAVVFMSALAYRFGFHSIPEVLRKIPNIHIPIVSSWIADVSKTYYERAGLEGLDHLLEFTWLITLSALAFSLIVTLPYFWRNPLTIPGNSDHAVTVYKNLHTRIYHIWFRPSYINKDKVIKLKNTDHYKFNHVSTKCLAELYVENINKSYLREKQLVGVVALASFYFFSGEQGFIDIDVHDVYVWLPLIITATGLVLEENIFFLISLIITFIKKTKIERE
jgi:hypothetical protein